MRSTRPRRDPSAVVTRVAILWHMHQPPYRDPFDGVLVLPWARLHAIKDYLGMVALLEETPGVHVTFNLVPCLVDQLEAYARGDARDPWQAVVARPAEELGLEERVFALRALFQAGGHLIEQVPRLAELYARRGARADEAALGEVAASFSVGDLRDLQVASLLAWFDRDLQQRDPVVRALAEKARGFTEQDKAVLLERERVLLAEIVPAYRRAAQRGQVELSTTPYYHPILPLLCDTQAHHEAHPGAELPRRFQHPEDAAEQIARAIARHTAVFGAPPRGLWPSEGSVSEDAVREIACAGLLWTASDEAVLERSLGKALHRDGQGDLTPLEMLYRPWTRHTDAGEIRMVFRDHMLSDLIGFVYTRHDPESSAADLLARLRRVGRRWREARLDGEPLVALILDGENAWEHYADGGRTFLRRLYRGLEEDAELQAVTMSEAVEQLPAEELPRVFAGSWIHADFSVWIGHEDDHRAWEMLADARDALTERAPDVSPESSVRAWESYRAACASDWCWWYGGDRTSDNDFEFDRLFRRLLQSVYVWLELPVPEALRHTLISTRPVDVLQQRPTGLVHPVLDGRVSSEDEWASAGVHRVPAGAAMVRSGHGVREVRFGPGQGHLHLLVETSARAHDLLGRAELAVVFAGPPAVRYRLGPAAAPSGPDGGAASIMLVREEQDGHSWRPLSTHARFASDEAVELAIPLSELDASPRRPVAFQVALLQGGIELERHPEAAPIAVSVEEGPP